MNIQNDNTYQATHSHLKNDYIGRVNSLEHHSDRTKTNLKKSYRRVRKYVRAHPGVGLAVAFAGGVLAGCLLSDSE